MILVLLKLAGLSLLMATGIWFILSARGRGAAQVVDDLKAVTEDGNVEGLALKGTFRASHYSWLFSHEELLEAGLNSKAERRDFVKTVMKWVCGSYVAGMLVIFALKGFHLSNVIVFGGMLAGLVIIVARWWLRQRIEKYKSEISFFLPVVMERLVMAVQAGLDIIPAVKAIVEVGRSEEDGDFKLDPVSKLLKQVVSLAEGGLGFSEALNQVALNVKSSGLRHAFIHLSVAHDEGGELVMPLRELSDSTQLYFQETMEEEIARLPVKATLPLLVTFLGLLTCFLSAPLIQVINMLTKASL